MHPRALGSLESVALPSPCVNLQQFSPLSVTPIWKSLSILETSWNHKVSKASPPLHIFSSLYSETKPEQDRDPSICSAVECYGNCTGLIQVFVFCRYYIGIGPYADYVGFVKGVDRSYVGVVQGL